MLKKMSAILLSSAIVMSVPVVASASSYTVDSPAKNHLVLTGANKNVDQTFQSAKKWSISTKGKTVDQIRGEVKKAEKRSAEAATIKKAKKLGVATSSKTIEQITKEIKHAEAAERASFEKRAKKSGVVTIGKTVDQIRKEVEKAEKSARETAIIQKAKKLGITVSGKTIEQVTKEVNHAEATH